MTGQDSTLMAAAAARFPDLTSSETVLIERTAAGCDADYRSDDAADNCPSKAGSWGSSRTLRAQVVAWLCTNGVEVVRGLLGIKIWGARITGTLDLRGACIPIPLTLVYSSLETLLLMDAKTSSLILTGSRVGQILADRVQIDGSLMVNQGFEAAGLVSIAAASVRGTLECSGATFMNAGFDQYSLMAAGIRIGAEAFLNGAAARGCLSFYRADIRGDLDLRRARIGDGAKALVGDYLTAGGVSREEMGSVVYCGIIHRWCGRCGLSFQEGCTTSSCGATRGRLSSETTGTARTIFAGLPTTGRSSSFGF